MAGLLEIPAVVRDPSAEGDRIAQQVTENMERADLCDLDAARALQQMLDLGATAEDVAAAVGATTKTVDSWTAVLQLPRRVLRLVDRGELSMKDAFQLVSIADSKTDLAEVVRDALAGHDLTSCVKSVMRRRAQELKRSEALAQLEGDGCRVVEAPQWGLFPRGSATRRLGKTSGYVDVTLAKHRKLPCHAGFVDTCGQIVYVCTNSRSHATKADDARVDRKAEPARRRADKKALRTAHAARKEAITAALRAGAIGNEDAVRHILTTTLWDADGRTLGDACALLDIAIREDRGFNPELAALVRHVGADLDKLTTAAIAVIVSRGERALTADNVHYGRGHTTTLHAQFLSESGLHECTDVERTLIEQRGLANWDDRRHLIPGLVAAQPETEAIDQ